MPKNFDELSQKAKRRALRRIARDIFLKRCVEDDTHHLWRVRLDWIDLDTMINMRQRHWVERGWRLEPYLDGLIIV